MGQEDSGRIPSGPGSSSLRSPEPAEAVSALSGDDPLRGEVCPECVIFDPLEAARAGVVKPAPVTVDDLAWAARECGAMDERAGIVAWLRTSAESHKRSGRLSRIAVGETLRLAADAIERGEHLEGDLK